MFAIASIDIVVAADAPVKPPGELDDGPGWILEAYATFTKYVWGHDAHNGYVLGTGVTWYFGLP